VNQLISQLVFLKVLAFHIRDDLVLEGLTFVVKTWSF